MRQLITGLALFFGMASAVSAANDDWSGYLAKSGFYVGGGVGEAKIRASQSDTRPRFNSDDTAWKVLVGIRPPIQFTAVEASYIDFGNPTDVASGAKVGINLTGWTAFLIGNLPLGPINLFAKGGGIRWHSNFTTSGGGFVPSSTNGTDFGWGGGVALRSQNLGVRAEYERFNISELDRVNLLSLAVTWTF